MTIRKVAQTDDRRIAEIIRDAFVEFGLPRTHTVFDDPDTDCQSAVFAKEPLSVLWVAEEGGTVVGSCGVYPTAGLPEGWCEIVKFYIDSNWRGRGIGHLLFGRALHSALSLGYRTAYLETFPQFAGAIGMYRRYGFSPLTHQMGNSGHTATSIWMTKNLRRDQHLGAPKE